MAVSSDEQDTVISMANKRAELEQRRVAEQDRESRRRMEGGAEPPKPWLTYTLIGLNVAVWLVMVGVGVDAFEPAADQLLAWGGNLGVQTTHGQWWRLLTATFIHAGIMHLAFNMYFMWAIGRITEQVFRPAGYALLYFGSGLIASLVSVAWQPMVVSVGASGALFGVFGGFLGFTIRRRELLPPEFVRSVRRNALVLIGINLAISFMVPNIDIAAHIGGLLAGLGIGYGVAMLAERPVQSREEGVALQRKVVAMMSVAVAVVLVAGILGVPRYDDVFATFDRVIALNEKAFIAVNTAEGDEARARAIETVSLPAVESMQAELAGLERVPKDTRDKVDALKRYADLTHQAFEHELKGLRTNDPIELLEAKRLHEEADRQP